MDIVTDTTAFRSMLDENMRRATEAWFADGLSVGLELGRAEVIEQGRDKDIEAGIGQLRISLVRQVAVKFGPDVARRFAPLVVEVKEAETLVSFSVALITADTESKLVAELERAQRVYHTGRSWPQ